MTCSCVKKKNSTLNGLPQGDGGARDRAGRGGQRDLDPATVSEAAQGP